MRLKTDIHAVSWRSLLSIILMVTLSTGFSLGGALASGCQGGPECLTCAQQAHPVAAFPQWQMEIQSCQPIDQNDSCSFETGQRQTEYSGIVPFNRTNNRASTGIVTSVLHEHDRFHLSGALFSELLLSNSGGAAAIYLRNQSLLC